jgi:acetate kinase
MKVLVLNAGSSSLKYRLFDVLDAQRVESLTSGAAEVRADDHREALGRALGALSASGHLRSASELRAVGHRVVHGGERFREPTLVDQEVLSALRAMVPLAPLHNPAGLAGIEVARATWPRVPQVAVFDTAYHHTLPPRAYRYAVPRELFLRHGVRRYGFHGTSHAFVARGAAALLGRPLASLALVTLHLGNGASAAAIRGGRSVDTSMGLTPLEGLVMGTRSGDVDPALAFQLGRVAGMAPEDVERLLERESGLLGLCGASDVREVVRRAAAGDEDAELALEVYCYRVKKYVGAYAAALGRLDALVFTAGVGENSAEVRARSCAGLAHLGIALDEAKNRAASREPRAIHAEGGAVAVLVIPTDEELAIAQQTLACVEAHAGR